MNHFKYYGKREILSLTRTRKYETKLGERIGCLAENGDWPQVLHNHPAKYVLFGIPEDMGVKANLGIGGTDTTWMPFLQAILNTQSNDYLTGEEILLLGHFDFGDLQFLIENNAPAGDEKINAYRHAVFQIDEEVEKVVKEIVLAGKIPVAIGGGHNNAYPLLKGCAKSLFKRERIPLAQINCINLDAHADYRALEGRHSGNAFSYAEEDGFLGKYAVIGLQESYISQNGLMKIQENAFIQMHTFEDIFIRERKNFMQAVSQSTAFTSDNYSGIEIDLDCIENVLSSACTPSGIDVLQARQFLHYVATDANVAYLHICEGAARLSDGKKHDTLGKLITYLVADFIKSHSESGNI